MVVHQAEVRIVARSRVIIKDDFPPRLRRGRPPYARAHIIQTAQRAIKGGIDPSLHAFCERVRSLLELDGFLVSKRTVLESVCKLIYQSEIGREQTPTGRSLN
jgi:hypothetical protein